MPCECDFQQKPNSQRTPLYCYTNFGLTAQTPKLTRFSPVFLHLGEITPGWNVIQTPEYQQRSDEFRRHARALTKAAQDKNLDGATLAYVQLTLACVECHKHVRHFRQQAIKKAATGTE